MPIPLWALKALPYVCAIVLVGGAVWYIDHRGYERAEAKAEREEQARKFERLVTASLIAQTARGLEGTMQTAINDSDARLVNTLNGLELTNRTVIQPTLVKEIQSETRFSDPTAGITDGMLREINRARSFSQRIPCPAGSDAIACYSLPSAESVAGQDNRNSSD